MSDPEPYRIEVDPAAVRTLRRLPEKVAPAIIEFITAAVAANPQRVSKPLTRELAGYRSARRGDYRVLLLIDEASHVVLVTHIDHRADVYRPK